MLRSIFLVGLLAVGARAQSGPPQVLPLQKQNGGIATFYSGNRIQPGQSPYILNGYLDADAAVVKRNGYQVYGTVTGCTQAITGGWSFTNSNGSIYSFVQCGGQMYKTSGDGTWSVWGSTISTAYPTRGVATLGEMWFTNGVDNLWYTDGVIISSVSTAPWAKLIGAYQNRLVLANITGGPSGSGFTAAQSGVWLSGYQNGTDFSLPAIIIDTSPAFIPLNGSNDTRQVSCLFDGYKSVELMWNDGQTWGLYGTGNSSFIFQLISNEIGCTDQNTVREYNGRAHWLSKRGIEDFDGTSITMISWPIQDQVQNLIALQQNAQLNTQTNLADWQAGNLSASGAGAKMNATLYPGDVVPSSWSVTDTAFTGTFSSAAIINGVLQISTGAPFYNAGFERGDATNWTLSHMSVQGPGSNSLLWGSYIITTSSNYTDCRNYTGSTTKCRNTLEVHDASDGTIIFSSTSYGNYSGQITVFPSSFTRPSASQIYVVAYNALYSSYTATSRSFPNWADGVTYAFLDNCQVGPSQPGCTMQFDMYENPAGVGFSSMTFVSQTFDTGFSTPTWGLFSSTFTQSLSGGTSVYFQTQVSRDGVTWDALAGDSDTVKIASGQKEFIRYKVTIQQSSSTLVGSVSAVGLAAETTGYFVSQCIQPNNMSSWGAIQADTLPNGGSFSFWVSTGATCAQAINPDTAHWVSQTVNTTITAATTSAAAFRVLFNLDVATEVPHLQDVTLNWVSGAARPGTSSAIYNKRYYLAYSSNTASTAYNDHVLVYDTNGSWTLLDDINAGALYTAGLKLYSASSTGDGKVYLQDVGTVDNGSTFNFVLQTPDIDFGDFAPIKDLDDWWIEAKGTTDPNSASTVNVNYFVDGGTIPYSAGGFSTYLPERGYLFQNGAFGLGGAPTKAHTLRLQYQNQSASPLRIYQTNLRFWPESLP